jgi:hypothetical protein
LMSTATQHRCERGSSTMFTLRMIAPISEELR